MTLEYFFISIFSLVTIAFILVFISNPTIELSDIDEQYARHVPFKQSMQYQRLLTRNRAIEFYAIGIVGLLVCFTILKLI